MPVTHLSMTHQAGKSVRVHEARHLRDYRCRRRQPDANRSCLIEFGAEGRVAVYHRNRSAHSRTLRAGDKKLPPELGSDVAESS